MNRYAAKIDVAPGMLSGVIVILRGYAADMKDEERQVTIWNESKGKRGKLSKHFEFQVVLSFDEIPQRIRWSAWTKLQVVMVRGLVSKFKQLIYANFVAPMTKKILFEVNESDICGWVRDKVWI